MKKLTTLIFAAVTALALHAPASETVEGAKKDYQSAKAEVGAQLEALDKKIDELKASAAQKSTAAKERTLKEAQATRAKLGAEYDGMKESAGDNWASFKRRVGRSLDKLNAKAQKALND